MNLIYTFFPSGRYVLDANSPIRILLFCADFCLLTHPIIPSLFVFPTGFGSSKHGLVWASRGRQRTVFVEDLSNIRWHLMEKDDTRLPLDVETSLSYICPSKLWSWWLSWNSISPEQGDFWIQRGCRRQDIPQEVKDRIKKYFQAGQASKCKNTGSPFYFRRCWLAVCILHHHFRISMDIVYTYMFNFRHLSMHFMFMY